MGSAAVRQRLLFVAPLVPDPGGVGLARRIASFLRGAARRFEVDLLVIAVAGGRLAVTPFVAQHCSRVVLEPCGPEAVSHCATALGGQTYDAVHVARLYMVPLARPWLPARPGADGPAGRPRANLDLDDIESRCHRRLAELHRARGQGPAAVFEQREALKYAAMERLLLPLFDRVFVCSESDRVALSAQVPAVQLDVIPNAVEVPASQPGGRPGGSTPSLLLVGNLGYAPNEDAAIQLAEEVVPSLSARLGVPCTLRLVGSTPTPRVAALARCPGVEVHRDVKAVEPFYREAHLAVVPLRSGGGTRLKILEAFAQGVPVVCSALAAEGIEVHDGRELLLAESPSAMAGACARLLRDVELAGQLARTAFAFVRAHHALPEVCARIAARLSPDLSGQAERRV
jgi:glycosyltransferase involved in cell wall biosynthesis